MLIPRSTFWFALPFAFAAARQAAGDDFPFPTPVASASMQAVSDLNGDSAYTPPSPAGPPPVSGTGTLYYQGIVLNAPATMLSTAASTSLNASNSTTTFGGYGQWQVFVQTNSQGDYGGTALYAAQNYAFAAPDLTFNGSNPDFYNPAQWNANVQRLSSYSLNPGSGSPTANPNYATLPSAGYQLQAGDRVEIIANGGLSFGGKWNINEEHTTNDLDSGKFQFNVVYLDHPGLPTPTPISLSQFASYDNSGSLPGPVLNSINNLTTTSLDNPEHFQGSYVDLEHVELVPGQAAHWQSGAGNGGLPGVLVTDGTREFTLWLGNDSGFTPGTAPTGWFNAAGIFDQEAPGFGPVPPNSDYLLWVMSPSAVTAVPEPSSWCLAVIGLAGLFAWRLRRHRAVRG